MLSLNSWDEVNVIFKQKRKYQIDYLDVRARDVDLKNAEESKFAIRL